MERATKRSILRPEAAFERCGFRRSKGHKDVQAGTFPPPVKLSVAKNGQTRASGFLSDELDAWIDAKAAGASEDELRRLVAELVAKRTAAASVEGGRRNG